MRIAIIDDSAADRAALRAHLQSELEKRRMEAQLEEFESGEDFLAVFTPGRCAAVFLDIYMGAMTGMEVARQIYREDPRCRIVFLSVSEDHALEGYSVRAAHYLLKPVSPEPLRQALDFCFPQPVPGDFLLVRTREGSVPVRRRDILYLESAARHGLVHLEGRTIESSDGFAALTEPLKGDRRFLLCGRGLMMQMEHVVVQRDDEFVMEDGRRLPISRRMRTGVLEEFRRFALSAMEETAQ